MPNKSRKSLRSGRGRFMGEDHAFSRRAAEEQRRGVAFAEYSSHPAHAGYPLLLFTTDPAGRLTPAPGEQRRLGQAENEPRLRTSATLREKKEVPLLWLRDAAPT